MTVPATPTGTQGPDISQLAGESLASSPFPAPRSSDFRVYIDPGVYAAMLAHASEDVSFEICGVLVGDWGRDTDGPFVNVKNYIRCDSAEKKFAEVTFTHESWSLINRDMDTKYQDQRIVGWYHSHPNFGIFLSDRDFFIQQNFFSGPGQIALVIDPVRKIEGVFEWRGGVTVPTPQYWVGSKLQLAPSGAGTEMPQMDGVPAMDGTTAAGAAPVASHSTTLLLLSGLCLFMCGWLLADWAQSSAQRRRDLDETMTHYGMWRVMRPDLEAGLQKCDQNLRRTVARLVPLAEDHLKRLTTEVAAEKDEAKQAALKKSVDKLTVDWREANLAMVDTMQYLEFLQKAYADTPEEREALLRFVVKNRMELQSQGLLPPDPAPKRKDTDSDKKPTDKDPKDKKQPAPQSRS
jgi:proteasome lid subunit RPN8/RPN11